VSLLIGTTSGLIRLDDGARLIEATRVNHVVRFGDDWWAVDGRHRVHHNGEVVATLPDRATAICVQPTPETVWIGSDRARLFALDDGEVTEDEFFANAPGRDTWYTPWGGPAAVRSMALDADRTLYVNVHVGGVLRYDDTGLVPIVAIDSDVHEVATHPSRQGVVFAATGRGLAGSHNGHDFHFRDRGLHATYCRAVVVLEDGVLVSASTGPDATRGRVYRADLEQGPLIPVTAGLPEWFEGNVDTHCLTVSGESVYLGSGDTVWASVDAGNTWLVAESGLGAITCLG
jgi:hypothetical protein